MPLSGFVQVFVEYYPELLGGLWVSVYATALSLLVGFPLGLGLALLGGSSLKFVQLCSAAFVELGRGAPTLVLLYFVYYGAPSLGLLPGSLASTVAALGFTAAVYSSEIFRSSIAAVSKGQHEGAQALGLSQWRRFRFVILPQAIRTAIPPTVGLSILIFQSSALAFAISLPELLSRAYNIGTITFQYFAVLSIAGVMYAAIAIPVSLYVRRYERRLTKRL